MKSWWEKYWPEVLAVLVQISLGVVLFASGIRDRIFGADRIEALRVLPLQITFLIAYFVLRSVIDRRVFTQVTNQLDEFFKSTSSVRTVHQDEFYWLFGNSIRSAKNRVAIAHLGTDPPPLVGTTEPPYYKELASLIKKRPHLRVRRVERLSQAKIPWIEKLIGEYRGVKNFSLRCIDLRNFPSKPPHISVQLIDDYLTFLVAVVEHYPTATDRDVVIRDKGANTIWSGYYDITFWNDSIKLIENGVVNDKLWSETRAKLNA
jgi:hypothetical protein